MPNLSELYSAVSVGYERIRRSFCVRCAPCSCAPCRRLAAADAADQPLEEIVVTASLRPAAWRLPVERDGTRRDVLEAAGLQHLQDVLGLVPNLNWSGGTSRPRYFQLRGIGELEQYQGAPNPSVGFLIDGIDFSGVGMPATLFDVEQVEVLRGPQGTRYGANAPGRAHQRPHPGSAAASRNSPPN